MSRSPSFIRTDKAIMQAFIELLKETPFEKITVQDILEKTPVTRATFYAHYHDKYEIAERMLEQFLHARDDVRLEISSASPSKMRGIVRKSFSSNRELAEALFKIHTDKVDLRRTLSEEFETLYLNESNGKAHPLEARIYAQARTELELSPLYDKNPVITFEDSNDVFLNVALKLLRLSEDEEAREFLKKKITQKFYSPK